MRRLFAVTEHSKFADFALLLLRVVVGAAFMFHGWMKIQQPFSWMGPDAAFPGFLQALAALSEFGGGLALILGLLTPLAALGIACTMAVAFSFHAFINGDPFVAMGPGQPSYELAAVFLTIAVALLALGPGRLALDRAFFGTRPER